jgi:hypothetical protein
MLRCAWCFKTCVNFYEASYWTSEGGWSYYMKVCKDCKVREQQLNFYGTIEQVEFRGPFRWPFVPDRPLCWQRFGF